MIHRDLLLNVADFRANPERFMDTFRKEIEKLIEDRMTGCIAAELFHGHGEEFDLVKGTDGKPLLVMVGTCESCAGEIHG